VISHSPLFSLERNGFEEVTLYGEMVLSDERGLRWSAGEAVGSYPARSLLKPFQFLACELPAERWQTGNLHNIRYAPCVGSISATADQIQVMDAWYRKGKPHALTESIQVPPAIPWDLDKRVQSKARGPQQLYHMCFSKHAAIVEACEFHGWEPKNYLSPDHPFHRQLVAKLEALLGRDLGAVKWVTDGCQLPSPVFALSETARLYQKLAAAEADTPLGWIRRLMLANPEWIGGPDRVDSRLMEANAGRVVAKEGADGLLGIAVLPDARHPHGLGVVVKIASGFDMKSAATALAPLLESLGLNPVHQVPPGHAVKWHYRALERSRRKLLDISPRVGPETAVWPGDRAFSRDVSLDMRKGGHLTLSSITTTVHVGAHTDAPNHYEASDRGIETVDLSKYSGPCQVIEVRKPAGTRIVPGDLTGIALRANRILFKTGSFPDPNRFNTDFVSLSGEVIEWLAGQGVCLVGIDTPSIDLFDSKDLPAHQSTLRTGVAVLEGIVLGEVAEGVYALSALPLKLAGADASPVRAVLYL
jgi:arylformamidase